MKLKRIDALASVHPYLYHYTNAEGFKGIVRSNSIWATHFRDLNDSSEIFHLKTSLIEALSTKLLGDLKAYRSAGIDNRRLVERNGGVRVLSKRLAAGWIDALYKSTFEKSESDRAGFFGVSSFCSHAGDHEYERVNGLLSQWRAYGRDGGYCLIFDTAEMIRLLEFEKAKYFYLHAELGPARYLFNVTSISDNFPELLGLSADIVKARLADDKNIGLLASKSFVPFVMAAALTKHRGFYEEREVRLLAIPATDVADAQIRDKAGYKVMSMKAELLLDRGGSKKRYISLFEGSGRLPLVKVLVGPSREQKSNVKFAKELLKGAVPVVSSQTPYVQ